MAERENLIKALESIADYAAMIKGGLQHLREAGLSEEGAEAVLLNSLMIPGYYDPEADDYDDWNDEDDDEVPELPYEDDDESSA